MQNRPPYPLALVMTAFSHQPIHHDIPNPIISIMHVCRPEPTMSLFPKHHQHSFSSSAIMSPFDSFPIPPRTGIASALASDYRTICKA